jgi:hypothetical protein
VTSCFLCGVLHGCRFLSTSFVTLVDIVGARWHSLLPCNFCTPQLCGNLYTFCGSLATFGNFIYLCDTLSII